MTRLPIEEVLTSLRQAVGGGKAVVLKAPPGAGKTTGVPPAVLQSLEDNGISGQIWVIQPRRLAARSVADWVARSRNESVGETIGYHVRLDRRESAATRVVFMTTGMFLRRMQSDPLLENVACVVLDEFHERTLELDLALAMSHRLRSELRDDLGLVVMSATMETEPIVAFLNQENSENAVSLRCEGRAYPVAIHHGKDQPGERIERRIVEPIRDAVQSSDGHVLVFLPGVGEIRRVQTELERANLAGDARVVVLHGSLSPKQQDEAIRPSKFRKIVLSTNIAETSVTVDGVTAVVDSGLAKVPRFDSRRGLTRLETTSISLASADQRSGRAGRTAPGDAYRLWSQAAQRSRDEYDVPEILRADLSDMVLMLASHGETDLFAMRCLTPPPEHAVDSAQALLRMLGAIGRGGRITERGKVMAGLPLHPRIARLATEAVGVLPKASVAVLAALMSERDPMEGIAAMTLAEKVDAIENNRVPRSIPSSTIKSIRLIAETIKKNLPSGAPETRADAMECDRETAVACALLAAYPDRVVLRRTDAPDRGRMVGGRGVVGLKRMLGEISSEELVLCYDVDGGGTESRVRAAVAIREDWLDAEQVETVEVQSWDEGRSAVQCRRQVRYGDLVLRETPAKVPCDAETASILFENLKTRLPIAGEKFQKLLHRIGMVAEVDEQVPAVSEKMQLELLRELCVSRSSLKELKTAPWADHVLGKIGYPAWQMVQAETPEEVQLPGGRKVPVHYVEGKPPWIEVKIQLCFGWPETPRILRGRVPLQLHLLGPNGRPQQITNDLASFWATTYGEIRKELRRRYPKHDWPEDPLSATASFNGMKRR
ncbi:ATP-dependent helicase HrpB [Rhodopirellula islandica]|uniref:ATP-dependent helicase HrpB n=1 Tax=Rhodopirellula islandica TaxID=595434 RepID=A0A0J1BC32_RHOIS|nr:ATP-dependent helicase HrpB [Rhodopirellula islandica]KLU04071.1 ATP-dependent helicase HrpB [Rhodopirellula islandica]